MHSKLIALICTAAATQANAQTPTPIEVLQQVTEAVCAPIANVNSGSVIKQKFEAEAGVKLRGVLKKFADAGLEGAAQLDSTEYVNGLASAALAGEIASQRDCNLRIYQDFSPMVQGWMEARQSGVSITSEGDCTSNATGSGNQVTLNCDISN